MQDTTENDKLIKQHLATAQSRLKSYADKRQQSLKFEVGDYMFLKIKPRHGVIRFRNNGKLAMRYIDPFEIIQRVKLVSYHLVLPPSHQCIHNVFHISMLRKYVPDPSYVILTKELKVNEDASCEMWPVSVVHRKEQVLHNRVIPLLKVIAIMGWKKPLGNLNQKFRLNIHICSYKVLFKLIISISRTKFIKEVRL